jgi:ABC-2 type transport system permease protein
MKKMTSKYNWLIVLVALVAINWLASVVHFRYDLTEDKRYTLSPATKKLLRSLSDQVSITVFLSGQMPAEFRRLSSSAEELLSEFQEAAKVNVSYRFERPGEGMNDDERASLLQRLDSMGLRPTNVRVQAKEGESQEERLVYPGALVSYQGNEMAIDLLQGQDMSGGVRSLNSAEALLEYKFANAVQKLASDSVPVIGYLVGNGQPLTYNVYDLIERTLKPNYGFAFVPVDSLPLIPMEFDALMVVKPNSRFSDQQKLKLDQYVMHGGKMLWFIDNLYAEMDSLMRTQSDFIAFDRGLNLEDQLFRYGVRINQDLLQDVQCDKLPQVVGSVGGQPQVELVPWPYFPLLASHSGHPIAKNLNLILSIFPNSLDSIATQGLRKTVLLASSANSRVLNTPAMVSLNSVKTQEEISSFNRRNIPVAMLVEGKFTSLFGNRISRSLADSLDRLFHQPFRRESPDNKMIVVSDADIVMNVVTQNEGPLQMGTNQFTKTQYANRDFLLNSIEYLVNPSGILETRGKTIELRLLDPARIEENKLTWQLINVVVPIVIVIAFALLYQVIRTKNYGSRTTAKAAI